MKRGTPEEQVARNREIWRARAQGYTWATIGERYHISPRRAQQIAKDYREEAPVDPSTQTEAIVETLEFIDRTIEEYEELIENTTHPAVKLGAMNAKFRALERRVAIEQSMGLLPSSLALIQQQEFALWVNDALQESIHRLKIAAPEHVLEPLDDLLLRMEVNREAWRRSQNYPRIQGELAARQVQREIALEERTAKTVPTDDAKVRRDGAKREADA